MPEITREFVARFSDPRVACCKVLLPGILAAGLLSGCGSDALPGLVPVSGRVTCGGSPVEEGSIAFLSVDGTHAFSSVLAKDGRYTMMASQSARGALPGEYRVSITGLDYSTSPPKPTIPRKYFELDTSELTATVPPKGGTIDFDLQK